MGSKEKYCKYKKIVRKKKLVIIESKQIVKQKLKKEKLKNYLG